ncbi:MAG: hypothetical protein CMO55_26375 [Verrucomicrobiales bacterium]|nr:hypothetical protein [Verrucomicrobiales bacterium]
MLWGMWDTWEWPMGDEAEQHFFNGVRGAKDFRANCMDWSPLYRYYFGLVFLQTDNALVATILHRFVIIFITVFLMFEAFRRLIPMGAALLVCLWWVAIPSNLNPLYTVHLFVHMTNLAALLGFALSRTPWGKGAALSVLVLSTLFVRTEGIVCVGIVSAAILWSLWMKWRKGELGGWRRNLLPYLVPSLSVVLIWLCMCAVTYKGIPGTLAAIRTKGAIAFTQNFSFTHFQRNPNADVNVWYEAPKIAEQEFGKELVSLTGGLRRNPVAVGKHFRTNLENLLPGIQLAFFNIRSAERNPEMYPTRRAPALAYAGTVFLVLLWIFGGWILIRDRAFFRERTFHKYSTAWICLIGFLVQAMVVSILVLARPSFYLSGIGSLFVLTAICGWALWRRTPWWLQWNGWTLVIALLAFVFVPSPWTYQEKSYDVPRAVFDALGQRRKIMAEYGTHIVAPVYEPKALALYLDPEEKIKVEGVDTLLPALESGVALGKWLYDRRAKLFLACSQEVVEHAGYKHFEENPAEYGWQLTGKHRTGQVSWTLFEPIQPYPEDLEKMKQMKKNSGE